MSCQTLKKKLSAHTSFGGDGEDQAEKNDETDNSLQQTTSKLIEKENKKTNGKTAKVFQKVKQLFRVESLNLDVDKANWKQSKF